jgi:hypothetical protein
MRTRFKRTPIRSIRAVLTGLLPLGLLAAAVLLFSLSMGRLDAHTEQESLRRSQAALSRAVAACYAIEGRYPPGLGYLRTHYGLLIDEQRYIVHYVYLADNLPPEMWVQLRHF